MLTSMVSAPPTPSASFSTNSVSMILKMQSDRNKEPPPELKARPFSRNLLPCMVTVELVISNTPLLPLLLVMERFIKLIVEFFPEMQLGPCVFLLLEN